MTLYVLLLCIVLVILVSVMHKWKLLLAILLSFTACGAGLLWYSTLEKGEQTDPAAVRKEIESVHIFYGNEKKWLLKDLEFEEILRIRYGIVINGTKKDSLKMMSENLDGVDGLWPSNELALAVFQKEHSDLPLKSQNIFSTPIVFFSWPEITDALIQDGIVEKRDGLCFMTDMKKFLDMILEDRTWEFIGLRGQDSPMRLFSPDPLKSNDGFLTAGLLAMMLNNGKIRDETAIEAHLPVIQSFYKKMGDPEGVADILFNRYIKQGQWAIPMISVCESQVIEFYQTHSEYHQDKIRRLVRVLIPEPTVLSQHPLIALTLKGEMLLTALQDPDIQKLVWQKHGFRPGVAGVETNSDLGKRIGLPDQIESFMLLPDIAVMEKITGLLGKSGENNP